MNFDKNDHRITAYALGEPLDQEAQAFIDQHKDLEEFHQAVADIRATAKAIERTFSLEATRGEAVSEASVLEQLNQQPSRNGHGETTASKLSRFVVFGSAIAAALALMLLVQSTIDPSSQPFGSSSSVESDNSELIVYEEIRVTIPRELIEGTPQPIKVPNLEPAPTEPPKIVVALKLLEEPESIDLEFPEGADIYLGFKSEDKPAIEAEAPAMPYAAPATKPMTVISANELAASGAHLEEIRRQSAASVDFMTSNDFSKFSADGLAEPSAEPKRELGVQNGWSSTSESKAKDAGWNREGYDSIEENEFIAPKAQPISTFSVDVDTASYANTRRFISQGSLPPADAVRIEELINYFDYAYPNPDWNVNAPKVGHPFSVTTEVSSAPWNPKHTLVRIGLQGFEVPWDERPANNLVFLVDVSGSMDQSNKLPLVKQALTELIQRLDRRDRVAIVVYAGSSGLALPSTTADNYETIEHALNNLQAGGSTNGAQGIELAYATAQKHFIDDGNNRVILCTDGDFNVGVSDRGRLVSLIEEKAKSGVFLSICGFGQGNYRDGMMESLSNKGNGNYAYIDTANEARKVFGEDLTSTLLTIANDVKIQVEFNPANVGAYRLIGYENRKLAAQDFNDDKKDAGEIGSGHSVTALYEIIPVGIESDFSTSTVDKLKYGENSLSAPATSDSEFANELMTVKLRYKLPDEDTSTLLSTVINKLDGSTATSADLQFASAVAEFGMLLRDSQFKGNSDWDSLIQRARQSIGKDPSGIRLEFIDLARRAQGIAEQNQ
ncbi:MAG: VWA domain-containing protein [Verrucomicrobiota bacterium]